MSEQSTVQVERAANEIKGYMDKLKELEPHLAAYKKANEKDPQKKAVADNVEKFMKDLYSVGGLVFDGDEKKFAANMTSIYKNLPALKEGLESIANLMEGDLSYGGGKFKRGHFSKYTKKVLNALGKYLKNVLTPQNIMSTDTGYKNALSSLGEQYKDFKNMVKDYVGRKVSFTV